MMEMLRFIFIRKYSLFGLLLYYIVISKVISNFLDFCVRFSRKSRQNENYLLNVLYICWGGVKAVMKINP